VPAVDAGITVGQADANQLIADRTGNRNESIRFTPRNQTNLPPAHDFYNELLARYD
jgi:hypothetical protein